MDSLSSAEERAILFRPSKKRKIYRQRAANDEDGVEAAPSPTPANVQEKNTAQSLDELVASASGAPSIVDSRPEVDGTEIEGVTVSMSEILRLRKRNKRMGGVEFKVSTRLRGDGSEDTDALVRAEAGVLDSTGGSVQRSFAPPTGAVGDVNKHMMAYIDSELAKRRPEETNASLSLQDQFQAQITDTAPGDSASHSLSVSKNRDPTLQRQAATIGKLQEIDLGEEARLLNMQRTQKARRLLNGEVVEDETKSKTVKVRLGPDGKPWRSRKRRGSEDIARDQAVEAVMRENRLEHYEPPTPPSTITPGEDHNADDCLAEAFQKQFMDSQRMNRKKPAAPAGQGSTARTAQAKKEEEVMKGPKLGGSRNQRASMRESMLKAAGVTK